MDWLKIEEAQKALCGRYGAVFVSTPPDDKIGFAASTALMPGTSGWYIWCGESFSELADFFEPQHASHFYESRPDASHLFGLPPGYRFLLAGDDLDVWFDEALLNV
jgi:hypothetical protein